MNNYHILHVAFTVLFTGMISLISGCSYPENHTDNQPQANKKPQEKQCACTSSNAQMAFIDPKTGKLISRPANTPSSPCMPVPCASQKPPVPVTHKDGSTSADISGFKVK